MRIEIFDNAAELAEAAALFIARQAKKHVEEKGVFSLALSGGSTPNAAYELLGKDPLTSEIPWEKVHLFWGDERCVPADDKDSNYRAALSALGPPEKLPAPNIHRIPAEKGPHEGADSYELTLKDFFGLHSRHAFDLILLGLGGDGHIASLFPDDEALYKLERPVIGVKAPTHISPHVARVSLTLPVINAAGQVLFMVSGRGKADIARKIFEEYKSDFKYYPGAMVKPEGELIWFCDRDVIQEDSVKEFTS